MTTITLGRTASGKAIDLHLNKANRHGLITGATGTGKSRALQLLAEAFSDNGVAVFMSDIKGDLSGMGMEAEPGCAAESRAADLKLPWQPRQYPIRFWDLMGKVGLPMRTTIHDMGRMLTSNMLECTDAQDRAIGGVFQYIKDDPSRHAPVLNLDYLGDYLDEIADLQDGDERRYGGITKNTARVLYGKMERVIAQGGDRMFGEVSLEVEDLIAHTKSGRGVINMLDATELMERPRLYGTWLTYLLIKLFRVLPEVGDIEKPKLVFFFDEAHLLFKNASAELLEEIERLVRLIRSRGVGVYFVTQAPTDVPDTVLAQLGNRIQFAMRAFTAKDAAAVKKIADTYRLDPAKKPKAAKQEVVDAITTMGVGEALVSPLMPDGTPMPVERVRMAPPQSHMGRLPKALWEAHLEEDPLREHYGRVLTEAEQEVALWSRTNPVAFQERLDRIEATRREMEEKEKAGVREPTFLETLSESLHRKLDDVKFKVGLF